MKKSLLLMAMCFAVSAGFAKTPVKVVKGNMIQMPEKSQMIAPAYKTVGVDAKTTRRSAATELFYAAPEGSAYVCWNKEGRGYAPSIMLVTPWQDFTFTNYSKDPTKSKWHFNYLNNESYRDLTENAEEDGNYKAALEPGYYMAAPTICDEQLTDSFTIGYPGLYWGSQAGYETSFTQIIVDSIATLSFINDHSNASAYGWGSLSTGYLYGTGTLDGTKVERGIGVCKAMYQDYPKPMSPLYVEDIFIGLKSVTLNPIPADGVARMYVIAMKEETREDEEGPYQVMVETTDTIAKLTATREDFVADGTPGTSSYSSTGAYQNYDVVFTQKEVDDFGMEMAVPFTIDQPFRVKIVGLDEEGVDFGVQRSVGITAEEAWTSEGVFQIYYPDIDKTYNHYYSNSGLPFGFTAMFDAVEIATSLSSDDQIFENTNYLKVSNDGTQCYVAAGDAALPGVYVYTAQPWTNEDMSEEYYYAEDVPEWILSLNVDISNYDDYNLNIVNATCEPLPEGVTGRYAELYIQGRGVKSVDPIYVIQGEVEITGINAVKNEFKAVNAATFNMAGQQVNKDFKGLVIKNGKKFMNK